MGISTGAVNQRSPRPATRIPKSVPLRAIVTTSVESATDRHGSVAAFPAAMAMFRKNWSLAAMKSATRTMAEASAPDRTSGPIIRRARSEEAATFR